MTKMSKPTERTSAQHLIRTLLEGLADQRSVITADAEPEETVLHRLEGAEIALWAAAYCEPMPIHMRPPEPRLSPAHLEGRVITDIGAPDSVDRHLRTLDQTLAVFDDEGWWAEDSWEQRVVGAEIALRCLGRYLETAPRPLAVTVEHFIDTIRHTHHPRLSDQMVIPSLALL